MIKITTTQARIVTPNGAAVAAGHIEIMPNAAFEYLESGTTFGVSAGRYKVSPNKVTAPIENGVLKNGDFLLAPTSGNAHTPENITYRVKFVIESPVRAQWSENWVFQDDGLTFEITDVPLVSVEEQPAYVVINASNLDDAVVRTPESSARNVISPVSGVVDPLQAIDPNGNSMFHIMANGDVSVGYSELVAPIGNHDDFEGRDSETTMGSTPGGVAWSPKWNATFGINVGNAHLVGVGDGPISATTLEMGSPNGVLEATVAAIGASPGWGVAFRWDDTQNHFMSFVDNGSQQYELRKTTVSYVAGSPTIAHSTLANAPTGFAPPAPGDTIRAIAHGDTIQVFVNGNHFATVTETVATAGTRCGLICNDTAVRWADFAFESATAANYLTDDFQRDALADATTGSRMGHAAYDDEGTPVLDGHVWEDVKSAEPATDEYLTIDVNPASQSGKKYVRPLRLADGAYKAYARTNVAAYDFDLRVTIADVGAENANVFLGGRLDDVTDFTVTDQGTGEITVAPPINTVWLDVTNTQIRLNESSSTGATQWVASVEVAEGHEVRLVVEGMTAKVYHDGSISPLTMTNGGVSTQEVPVAANTGPYVFVGASFDGSGGIGAVSSFTVSGVGVGQTLADGYHGRLGIGKTPDVALDVLGDSKVSGNVTASGDLTVRGDATVANPEVASTLRVGDPVANNGTLDVNGNAEVSGTLLVEGNTTLGNQATDTTTVSGPATFSSTVTANDTTQINGLLDVNGNAEVSGALLVEGNTTLGSQATDTTTVTGPLTVARNTTIADAMIATTLQVGDATADNGALDVNGTADVSEALSVGGIIAAGSDISVTGNVQATGDIDTSQTFSLDSAGISYTVRGFVHDAEAGDTGATTVNSFMLRSDVTAATTANPVLAFGFMSSDNKNVGAFSPWSLQHHDDNGFKFTNVGDSAASVVVDPAANGYGMTIGNTQGELNLRDKRVGGVTLSDVTNDTLPAGATSIIGAVNEAYNSGSASLTSSVALAPDSGTRNTVTPTADHVALTVQGVVSQQANLQEWQDSNAAVKASIDAAGNLDVQGGADVAGSLVVAGSSSIQDLTLAGAFTSAYTNVTTNHTVTSSDGMLVVDASAGTVTLTLPSAAGIAGREYTFKRIDSTSNVVTVAPSGSETIEGAANYTLELKFDEGVLMSDGANWLVKTGKSRESLIIAGSDESSALETGKCVTFRMPYAFTLLDVRATVNQADTASALNIDIQENGESIFGAQQATISAGTTTSASGDLIAPRIAEDAELTVWLSSAGTPDATGLKIYLVGRRVYAPNNDAVYLSDDFAPDNLSGMSVPETGAAWSVAQGTPIVQGQTFSGNGNQCVVYQDIGIGDNFVIKGSLGTAGTSGSIPSVTWCNDSLGTVRYELRMGLTDWQLYKIGGTSPGTLATYAAVPATSDDFVVKVVQGGDMLVYVNGVLRLSHSDSEHRGEPIVSIISGFNGGIGVHSSDGAYVIRAL